MMGLEDYLMKYFMNFFLTTYFSFFSYLFIFSQININDSLLSPKPKINILNYNTKANAYKLNYFFNSTSTNFSPQFQSSRHLFILKGKSNEVKFIWQDERKNIYLSSIISCCMEMIETIKLNSIENSKLIGACIDEENNIYFLTIIDKTNDVLLEMRKINLESKLEIAKTYDCSKENLNIWYQSSYDVDMEFSNGKIGLLIARRMFASDDGLNHQGGIACIFDCKDLNLIKNFGQTSGHSFDNFLTVSSEGKFLGVDLGDNYPRGINIHLFFDEFEFMKSKVIYTFKTLHESTYKYGTKIFSEISNSSSIFYTWSNDNNTYTEIGGLIETEKSFLIIFAGEPDINGKSLNNSRAGYPYKDPRTIGYVEIKKDFYNSTILSQNEIPDDLVLSNGPIEYGGFFDYSGKWTKQRNKGVTWLKDQKYDSSYINISNLKACKINNNEIIIVWKKNDNCFFQTINSNGKPISEIIDIGKGINLSSRDEMVLINNFILIPLIPSGKNQINFLLLKI